MTQFKQRVEAILRNAFHSVDADLVRHCTEKGGLDYASSTGVTALLWPNQMLTVAHVGDSKCCICSVIKDDSVQLSQGKPSSIRLNAELLTVDHKPHHPHELQRIKAAGGSLVYLHGSKPFIRGADFLQRQAAGEHPKQVTPCLKYVFTALQQCL